MERTPKDLAEKLRQAIAKAKVKRIRAPSQPTRAGEPKIKLGDDLPRIKPE